MEKWGKTDEGQNAECATIIYAVGARIKLLFIKITIVLKVLLIKSHFKMRKQYYRPFTSLLRTQHSHTIFLKENICTLILRQLVLSTNVH